MNADAYPDSPFLVSLHCADANHAAACAYLTKSAHSLAFTPLHRVEVRNALRNATSLGVLAKAELATAFRQIEEDLRDGLLLHIEVPWTDVFRRADLLSEKYSETHGQRNIDLLHVAIALECEATIFLSFDKRQRGLARTAGLKVKP